MAPPRAPVVRHLPGIGVTVISRWVFNCYVIHDGGDGRPFVVDVGMSSHLPVVARVLNAGGASLADLSAAIATHGHADHVGGLPALRTEAATPVLLPRVIAELRAGTRAPRSPGPREVAQILPVLADQPTDLGALRELAPLAKQIGYDATGVRFAFEPAAWLDDGDHLPGAPDWRVIAAPGHTDDSTCLYHEPTRTLLSGDSVLSIGGRAWFNPEYVDGGLSSRTEDRLRGLDVAHLLPGHGRPVVGDDLLGRALGHDERPADASKLRALVRILRNHRLTA